jgi:DNA gyrase subunit B
VKKGKDERYLKDDASLEDHLIQLGSDQAQVIGTGSTVPLAGEALANVLRRFSHLDRVLDVIERGRRNRDVVMAATREETLGPEAFRDRNLLETIADSLRTTLVEVPEIQPVSVSITQSGEEIPAIMVETQHGNIRDQTLLSLEFCASPEFEEVRRLAANLADAGHPPFAVVSGELRIEMPTLPAAVRHIMASARKGLEIQRYKGLGEMNPDQLWATTMDPEKRTLLQVRVDDLPEADLIFSMLMGDAVEPRRKFIEDHALSVKNLDI